MGGVEFDPQASGPFRALTPLPGRDGDGALYRRRYPWTEPRPRAGRAVRVAGGSRRDLSISYRGTLMRFAHPQAFIRLEDGLAASWIEPPEVGPADFCFLR